jgi:hypothetical protein
MFTKRFLHPVHGLVNLLAIAFALCVAAQTFARVPPCATLQSVPAPELPCMYKQVAAYDEARGRVVLYQQGNTWELIGGTWTLRTTAGPQNGVAMAYDAARGNVVLWGSNGTWTWDGSTWTLRTTAGPDGRVGAAMCYDPGHGQVVLFGGTTVVSGSASPTDMFGDTWIWNGLAWVQRQVTGPSGRSGASMAYDFSRQEVILFGGNIGNGTLVRDTWRWNGGSWQLAATSGPSERQFSAAVFAPSINKLVLSGGQGYNLTTKNDLWQWDGVAWEYAASGPELFDHKAVLDTPTNRIVLVGGSACSSGNNEQTRFLTLSNDGNARIDVAPLDTAALIGQDATLSVSASSFGSISYRWRRNGVLLIGGTRIQGVTTPTLKILRAEPNDSGDYSVDLTTTCGTITSRLAKLSVSCGEFQIEPQDAQIDANTLLVLEGIASSPLQLTYQWLKDGVYLANSQRVSGTDTNRLEVMGVTPSDNGIYTLEVLSDCLPFYSRDTLVRIGCVRIATEPSDTTVESRSDLVLNTSVVGSPTMTLRWYRNGAALLNGGRISGATGMTLHIREFEPDDAGLYTLRASNYCGSIRSRDAFVAISVGCKADTNADGFLDFTDFDAFVGAFEAGAPAADFNGDSFIDFTDFDAYVSAFEAGC